MARKIHSRLKIKGTLIAETPIHIGGFGENYETDLPLAKNGRDEFYIPGTSLTGVLRAWFETAFDKGETKSIWGFHDEDNNGQASFVIVEDIALDPEIQSEIRDHVSIDRVYGTAANQAKFDRMILPKGTELKDFEIIVEIQRKESSDKVTAMFGHLLQALIAGKIALGASRTRGLGQVKLKDDYEIYDECYYGKGILNILEGKKQTPKNLSNFDLTKINPNEKSILDISIVWQPLSPLMMKSGADGIGVDILPLVSEKGKGRVALVLSGSSIKGTFRSHAERIVRTLFDVIAANKFEDPRNFGNQIRMLDKNGRDAGSVGKLISELFGAKKEKEEKNERLGLGALSFADCYAVESFEQANWREVEQGKFFDDKSYFEKVRKNVKGREVEDVTLHQALKKLDLGKDIVSETELINKTNKFSISHHTAIDRFTGAAAESALFSVLKPSSKTKWENIKLRLDLSRFDDEFTKKCALMLILLVLRDFAQNRLPLGFNVNRGMGEINQKEVEINITGEYEIKWTMGGNGFTFSKGSKSELEGAWKEWIKN